MAFPSLFARLLRYGGSRLVNRAVTRVVPPAGPASSLPGPIKAIGGAALMRIATRSVPGAILVGGGLLAKTLYDRRRALAGKPQAAPPLRDDDEDEFDSYAVG